MARKETSTICIVDPDRDLHSILAAIFALEGHRVVSATRARDALNKLNLQRFAAIFVDPGSPTDRPAQRMDEVIKLPGLTGGMNSKTPVILMGGHPETKIAPEALPAIAAVIAKPFTVDDIVATLRNVLHPA